MTGAPTASAAPCAPLRHMILVLGDQLDEQASAFDGFDPERDAVWMAEVAEESTHVWSARQRIALFLSAMRHFAESLRTRGWTVHYTRLDDGGNQGTLAAQLESDIGMLAPEALVMTAPGDWRVLQALRGAARASSKRLDIRDDRHFFSTVRDFAAHAQGRKQLRLEYWYRQLRTRHGILMAGGKPEGGQWNFDADNRESFGAAGPGALPPRSFFAPDEVTLEVMALVNSRFSGHPGTLDSFGWPVTRAQALLALQAFIAQRL
ncbi:MAG: cryptochrome/photolyase family protein, partial [Polaromonas sp.]|nr:cryptochrome/photolyase family protein [Polaromonas sp.]